MSNLFNINSRDFLKSCLMAVLVPVMGYVLSVLQSGSFGIDLHQVLTLAVSGFVAYLFKQFVTDTNGKIGGLI